MRSNNAFNPLDISTFPTIMAKKYTITLITARDLFDTYQNNTSGIDPYIVIKTRGVPSDHRTEKSAIVHNNGFCPRWNEEKVFIINIPQLAFISFIVWDKGRISILKGIVRQDTVLTIRGTLKIRKKKGFFFEKHLLITGIRHFECRIKAEIFPVPISPNR